jgi:hypothetical protein
MVSKVPNVPAVNYGKKYGSPIDSGRLEPLEQLERLEHFDL